MARDVRRRNHDLLVTGAAAAGRIVVGVEGKADEPFGESLAAYRDTSEARGRWPLSASSV